ncbi:MAG: diphthamide biosynthesis enzyme Dph2 [Candidatus Aenigmarchaeota archaeon]|nr:diphthamide biosynthesis enzyme Dph2 [Candidatus Aenigmarchaeota archaeon]
MEEAIKKLKKIKAKKVLVQFPEGLKLRIQEIAKELEKNGFEVMLCLEPCFGACDIRDEEAKRLGCDAILHIGHEEFLKKVSLPVVYWEYFIDTDPTPILEKEFEKIKIFEKIGIVTSIQFVKTVRKVKEFLEQKEKKVFLHKALQHSAQILGCNLKAAEAIEKKVDCFLCVSAGKFYGLGLVLKTNKPVFCLDLEKGEIYSLEDLKRKIEKIIAWNKTQLKDAKKVGILVSWKKGQIKKNFFEFKKKLEKEGKEVYVLVMDEITPEKIEGLSLDFLINFSCPRIGIDDLDRYKIPILNLGFAEEF